MESRPLFQQDVTLLMQEKLLQKDLCLKAYAFASRALKRMEQLITKGYYPFLEAPFLPLDKIKPLVQLFQDWHVILIIGTKESTLSIRAMMALLQSWVWVEGAKVRICFLDRLDPEVFWEMMSMANPATTGVIVFSQSGQTESTILQLMRCLEYWGEVMTPAAFRHHFMVITSPGHTPLRTITEYFGLTCIEYPSAHQVTCFSPEMLIPVMIAGFDAEKFNKGAALTYSQCIQRQLKSPLEGVALLWVAYTAYGAKHHTLFPSTYVFEPLINWMSHLWHTKFFRLPYTVLKEPVTMNKKHFLTVFWEQNTTRERLIPQFWQNIPAVTPLARQSLLECAEKEHMAFCKKKIKEGHFLRSLKVNILNEETLGALFMNHILEAIMMQDLYNGVHHKLKQSENKNDFFRKG